MDKDDDVNDEYEDERKEEWNEFRESMRQWKDQYKEILHDWKDKISGWRDQIEERAAAGASGFHFDFPPAPPVPPIPPLHSMSTGRANVVASRIGDEDIRLIDMLIEAGVFGTRSEAVAYLVSEGIKARRDTFEKVSTSLEEIRKTRREAERQVEKLREEIGLKQSQEPKETTKQDRKCPKCGRQIVEEGSSFCPFCGSQLLEKGN
jgi:rubrerythrin